jgi:hypothetical protein
LPVDGHGWLFWNACRASGLRLILPWLSRAQVAHLAAEDRALWLAELLLFEEEWLQLP